MGPAEHVPPTGPADGPASGVASDRGRWGWPVLAVVAAVSNLSFLLRPLVGSSLAPLSTEISALSVNGQPLAWAFRTGDTVFGLATALLALGVRSRPGPWRRRSARLVAVGLAVAGLANVLAAAVPESSTHAGARVVLGSSDAVHDGASLVAGMGLVLGVVACAHGLVRSGRGRRHGVSVLTVVLAVALTGLSAAEVASVAAGGLPGSGAVQRAQVLVASVWTVVVGVLVGRARTRTSAAVPAVPMLTR